MKKFRVEVGQIAETSYSCFSVSMGDFRVEADTVKEVISIALSLAKDSGIDDAVILNINCEDIIYDL